MSASSIVIVVNDLNVVIFFIIITERGNGLFWKERKFVGLYQNEREQKEDVVRPTQQVCWTIEENGSRKNWGWGNLNLRNPSSDKYYFISECTNPFFMLS